MFNRTLLKTIPKEEVPKLQKEVIKDKTRFTSTNQVLLGGCSKPIVAHKQAKNGTKPFALKSFAKAERAAYEKICYDLLRICGVRVPKTYLLADEKGEYTILASRIEENYKDLLLCVGGSVQVLHSSADFPDDLQKTLSSQTIHGKKITGLYENDAVFMFLVDHDAIGESLQNVGLIEQKTHFETVKIDPGGSILSSDLSIAIFEDQFLSRLSGDREKYDYFYRQPIRKYQQVFCSSTDEQIMDGMRRVARLSDEQLHAVIYNEQIPSFTKDARDNIYTTLLQRRDALKKHLFISRQALLDEIANYHTTSIFHTGKSSKTITKLDALAKNGVPTDKVKITEIENALKHSSHRLKLFKGEATANKTSTDKVVEHIRQRFI